MNEEKKKPANLLRLTRAQIKEGLDQIPIDRILGHQGNQRSLTHKQRQFAKEVAMGATKADAYRKVYNSKMKPKQVGNAGSKLAKHKGIDQEITALRLANEAMEYLKADRLKALVLHQLTQHALNEDNPPASRIRSLELLGKSAEVGLFLDRKEVTTISTSSDAKASLLKTIQDAMKRNSIEVDYSESGESLLDELKATPAPSENFEDEPATPPTTLNEPPDSEPSMHNNLHNQSQEIDQSTNPPSEVIDFIKEKK
jgi:hypothetical protein